jgi:hypothetical protein
VLVETNVAAFAEGRDAPLEEVRHYLAVREAAHARLFTHVTWLRSHLLGLVERYARGITIDVDVLEQQVRDIDMSDPEALRGALTSGVFGLQHTEEQRATLLRLETALALVEAGLEVATLVDPRPLPPADLAVACGKAGIPVRPGYTVLRAMGRRGVKHVEIGRIKGAGAEIIAADVCGSSGGLMPLINLHTTGDPIVPFSQAGLYDEKVRQAGSKELFTQIDVVRPGHCSFQADELLSAFSSLWQQIDGRSAATPRRAARALRPRWRWLLAVPSAQPITSAIWTIGRSSR